MGEQDVWDIQVEEDHSYVAHGFINHNSAPNTQQTPKSCVNNYNIRMIYVPHRHMRLIGGDLSQAELRIMADRSGDRAMVDEYRKDEARWKATNLGESAKGLPKSDLHQTTADACAATRDDSKGINFGNLYGMSAKKLASVLTTAAFDAYMDGRKASFDPISDTVQVATANDFQVRFFNKYSGVKAYQEYVGNRVLECGYAKTRWGRIRYLPDAFASDKWLRLAAQRAGINHTIQGHVAEMVLFCMCRASNEIPNQDGLALKKLGYRLLQQVHDEVQGEGPDRDQDVQDICFHLTRIFQNPGVSTDEYPYSGYRVPILFDVKSSYDWHSTH